MKTYAAKVLLFGEYTIIKGTAALAFPLNVYQGSWQHNSEINTENLKKWSKYIDNQDFKEIFKFDKYRFEEELSKGLHFHSTIPIGYGVGSSGALCAALYEEFSIPKKTLSTEKNSIFELKTVFQTLENFFHGSSSGIDPLICYLQKPLLLKGKEAAEIIDLEIPKKNGGAIFLLDTKQPRQTEPLVKFFLESLKKDSFNKKIETELCVYNQKAINAFLNQNEVTLFENLALIAKFQYDYFPPMIPKGFEKLWAESLEHDLFSLKLCGAGGGGFILGFTQNWSETQFVLKDFELIKIQSL
jgi:mevalonate kinase